MNPLQRLEWWLFRFYVVEVEGRSPRGQEHAAAISEELRWRFRHLRRRLGLWIAGAE